LSDEAAAMAFIDVRGDLSSPQQLERSEDIQVLLLDHEAVCRLCDDRGAHIDAKLWTVLYLYRQLGTLE
jgi:hypothetical protein